MIAGAQKVVQEVMSGDAAAAKTVKKQSKTKTNGTDIAAGMKSLEVNSAKMGTGDLTHA